MAKRVLVSHETGTGDLVANEPTTGTATTGTDPTDMEMDQTTEGTEDLLEGGVSNLLKAKEGSDEESANDI